MVRQLGIATLLLLLAACASLRPGYEQPEIHLVSIRPLPSENLEQRFILGLRIINPNDIALPVSGFSYSLSLQGNKVLSGATASVTDIPAFGNVLVELDSSTSLLGSLGVLRDMLSHPDKPFSYEMAVRIHSNWWTLPVQVVESGEIDLAN